jgi:hypothetical protein
MFEKFEEKLLISVAKRVSAVYLKRYWGFLS